MLARVSPRRAGIGWNVVYIVVMRGEPVYPGSCSSPGHCRGNSALIGHLDHLVLTTTDEKACIAFYVGVLGMAIERFEEGRTAFRFGRQKINLHLRGHEYEPHAHLPVPGALDLCFIAARPLDEVIDDLAGKGVRIIEGPIMRSGAAGPLRSIYLRDPDLTSSRSPNS
jgi:catechol 2,3-dioxygenase-like lactoylglutathione lyase family enzyme